MPEDDSSMVHSDDAAAIQDPDTVRLLRLARALTAKTRDGSVKWDHNDNANSEGFIYETDLSYVTVERANRTGFISLEVYNRSDTLIGSIEMTDSSEPPIDEPLEDLYDQVRRKVLQIDEILDTLLVNLES